MRDTRLLLFVPLLPGVAACSEVRAADGFHFVDRAADAGIDVEVVAGDPRRFYIVESNGSGAAWLDFDLDGDVDLFVGNGRPLRYPEGGGAIEASDGPGTRLYRNDGDWEFRDVSVERGARRSEWVNAVTVADADGDGDPDLHLACFGPDAYLRNDGGRFSERSKDAGLENAGWGAGATFGDPDLDGDLDLYVANYVEFDLAAPPMDGKPADVDGVLVGWGPEAEHGMGFNVGAPDVFFRNEGGGRFREATREHGLALEKALCSYAAVFCDVDANGLPDLCVANDLQPCNLFINQGEGRFRDEATERGFATDGEGRATAAMGLAVADVDRDGDEDILRTNFDMEPNALHLNDGNGHFQDAAGRVGLAAPSEPVLGWGAAFFDAELDGDLDLVVTNGHVLPRADELGMHAWAMPTQFFEARIDDVSGLPRYSEVGADAGPGFEGLHAGRGLALADVDDDGDLDCALIDLDARPRLLENRSERKGRWIAVRLKGRGANTDALGARVEVELKGGRRLMREARRTDGLYGSHDPRLHFGLGQIEAVVAIHVRWPSGVVSRVDAPPLDALSIVEEPELEADGQGGTR